MRASAASPFDVVGQAMRPAAAARQPSLQTRVTWAAAAVLALGMLLIAAAGYVAMRRDVAEELRAARASAELTAILSRLHSLPDAAARDVLAAWEAEHSTRHVDVVIRDALGHTVVGPAGAALSGGEPAVGGDVNAFAVRWASPRPTEAGAVTQPRSDWQVELRSDPGSEQAEFGRLLRGGALLFVAVGLILLGILAFTVRRALAPLAQLHEAIGALRQGDNQRLLDLPRLPSAELHGLADALRGLSSALSQAEAERRQLAAKMITLQEDERQHLAHELHDEFGQRLTALRVDLAWLARRLARDEGIAPVVAGMQQQCEAIALDIKQVLARLRPLSMAADPPGGGVDAQELLQRLGDLASSWLREGAGGLQVTFLPWAQVPGQRDDGAWPPTLPQPLALALYRISQEALTNVARHAQASHCTLSVGWQDGEVHWCVSDDGIGLPECAAEEAMARGHGLAGIRQRVWALGGDLRITSAWPQQPQRQGLRLEARFDVSKGAVGR